jgi:hypothetical protein
MDSPLYSDVILLQDLPEEGLHSGDIGTVVEVHKLTTYVNRNCVCRFLRVLLSLREL